MSGTVGVVATVLEVPLIAAPQRLTFTLNNVRYGMALAYHDAADGGWTLDLFDSAGNALVAGLALTTGLDLLGQHAYLGIGAQLYVVTDGDPLAPPTFDGLGSTSHLYVVPS